MEPRVKKELCSVPDDSMSSATEQQKRVKKIVASESAAEEVESASDDSMQSVQDHAKRRKKRKVKQEAPASGSAAKSDADKGGKRGKQPKGNVVTKDKLT